METSEELPTQLWITGVSNITNFGHGGGEADIYRARYRDLDVALRVVRIKPNARVEDQIKAKKVWRMKGLVLVERIIDAVRI